MNCYAVIDTNVLVSALLSDDQDAATVQVIDHLFFGDFIPIFSKEIWDEYNEVLRRNKFHFSENSVEILLDTMHQLGKLVSPNPSREKLADEKDLPFYETVLEWQDADAYLVTGNKKHFPQKPYIITAREFLAVLSTNKLRTNKEIP